MEGDRDLSVVRNAGGGEEEVTQPCKGSRGGDVERFGKRRCCSVGGDRNSSLGGKKERGGCGRWAMEQGGGSEMRAEAQVKKLRISWCFLSIGTMSTALCKDVAL